MDRASLWTAQGIPFAFARVQVGEDKELRSTLPSNGQHVAIDPFLAGASN